MARKRAAVPRSSVSRALTALRPAAHALAGALPTGTVTFLFTDLEGQTPLWERHPEAMRAALARHDALLRAAVLAHDGCVVKATGDGLHAVFALAPDALAAALAAQRDLAAQDWGLSGPLRARMGLHSGACEERDGDYFGPAVNRAARVMQAAHGGQVLLSQVAAGLVRDGPSTGMDLRDLGEHLLKDLREPERLFQAVASGLPDRFPPPRALGARAPDIPVQLTSFVGREREVAEVARLLKEARLVTLTGPGGSGKTRLALRAAVECAGAFPDGVVFVDLAPVRDPGLVVSAVAGALGVREVGVEPLLGTLERFLRGRTTLLVLDNFEQVLAGAPAVSALLGAGPRVAALVTSRAPLRLSGEHELAVPPLALPDRAGHPPLDQVAGCEAVRLFAERARAVRADFALTAENAPAVLEICRRLDGLPLAIELAAARVRTLPPPALLARLDRRLPLLISGPRDAPARQRTLRDTIDWSYELLTAAEQALFRRLGVFVGGCTLEAAVSGEGVGETAVLDGLEALVQHSLVRQEEVGGEPRFALLETVREYALERLLASGGAEESRRRHAGVYLALAERAESRLHGPEQMAWLAVLELERGNVQAALAWCLERAPELALRLVGALYWFWHLHSHLRDGRAWLEAVLARTDGAGRTAGRARALQGLGQLVHYHGEPHLPVARAQLEESVAIWRELGDRRGLADALVYLGIVAGHQGDRAVGRAAPEESVALWRAIGDDWGLGTALWALGTNHVLDRVVGADDALAEPLLEESVALLRRAGDSWALAGPLYYLAVVAHRRGDRRLARERYEEAAALLRHIGDKWRIAVSVSGLGRVALETGDRRAATAAHREALRCAHDLGHARHVSNCLEELALVVATATGPAGAARAGRLLGAAAALAEEFGRLNWLGPPTTDLIREALRGRLDETQLAVFVAEGQALTLDQAVAYALTDDPPDAAAASAPDQA
jgi:predicted ATPase/class 3 adenylate cyclase